MTRTDSTPPDTDDRSTTLTFMCVRNAGRSQMAAAFAERERSVRGLGDAVAIRTGGTDPAETVHRVVVEAMNEAGIEISNRTPRAVSDAELAASDVVVTMGCSTLELDGVETRDWALTDPGERPLEEVRAIRDEVERRVVSLFDELFGETVAE